MYPEDGFTASQIRSAYNYTTVKTSRAEQCRIENIRSVGCRQSNDSFIGTESIHFYQQLIQCLFTFIMASAKTGSTLTAYRINFIDKHNTWSVLLSLRKQVSYTGCPYADKHFHKIRTGNGEEWYSGFPGNGLGKQGLTCTWRPYQQDPLRYLSSQSSIPARIFKEVHHFCQFFLSFIFSGYILKRNIDMTLPCHLGTGFAKVHNSSAASLCLVHDPEPYTNEDDDWKHRRKQTHPPGRLFRRSYRNRNIVVCHLVDQRFIVIRKIRRKFRPIF